MNQLPGLLLVDDEPNILASLKRLFRRDDYTVYIANSGAEGLEVLKNENIGVIVSDQRMPGMTGSEFLGLAKEIKPDTIRIILSGYTELSSITEAINRGAIYKFLTKPWDDDLLRTQVREAFRHYQLHDENIRLTGKLTETNLALSTINAELESRVAQRTSEMMANLGVLKVKQEILDALPIGVLGFTHDGMLTTVNQFGMDLFGAKAIISSFANEFLSGDLQTFIMSNDSEMEVFLNEQRFNIRKATLGKRSDSCGFIIVLIPLSK